ncbi:MAG: YggS family pyridoxal phosphate-dependent enzyme [Ardenticatenales bacterium]|nr:YggS family pyridoxal phosphate-dependent enzyme [Ardenticatenales bacterium]
MTTADSFAACRVAERIAAARARIAAAAMRAGRDPGSVTLLAVTKAAGAAQIVAALASGVTDFGENRVADAEARIADVAALVAGSDAPEARPCWHFIGHLQSNKARRAVALFDRIDTVHSVPAADRLSALAGEAGRTLPVLLEVNIARDPARSGFAPEAVAEAAGAVLALPHLRVDGLMGIAPLTRDAAEQRGAFALLRTLRRAVSERYPMQPLPTLSMGMSDDFEVAIDEGSTEVRLGRALFAAEG